MEPPKYPEQNEPLLAQSKETAVPLETPPAPSRRTSRASNMQQNALVPNPLPAGEQIWLERMTSFKMRQSSCLANKIEMEAIDHYGNVMPYRFQRRSTRMSNSYDICDASNSFQISRRNSVAQPLATINTIGSNWCGMGHRSVHCPPDRPVITSFAKTERFAPITYEATPCGHSNPYVNQVLASSYTRFTSDICGSKEMMVFNNRGQQVAYFDTPLWRSCGHLGSVVFTPQASPLDKLVAIDMLCLKLDLGYANTFRWCPVGCVLALLCVPVVVVLLLVFVF